MIEDINKIKERIEELEDYIEVTAVHHNKLYPEVLRHTTNKLRLKRMKERDRIQREKNKLPNFIISG